MTRRGVSRPALRRLPYLFDIDPERNVYIQTGVGGWAKKDCNGCNDSEGEESNERATAVQESSNYAVFLGHRLLLLFCQGRS